MISKIQRIFSSKYAKRWPLPKFDKKLQPHFLFIITPPYSGSTAIAQLLNTSPKTMVLRRGGEGQWLLPGLCEKDRWLASKKIDYSSVKAVWLSIYQEKKNLDKNIQVVIEKSPPNMMRIESLSRQFKNFSFIANNRNPYANCASILYREYDVENLNSNQREDVITGLAKKWLERSLVIRDLILRLDIPLLTYENFCKDPSSIIKILALPDGVSKTINPAANIKVKDYKEQPIINQNQRQIASLTGKEIELIGSLIRINKELLNFFSYELI